MLLEQGQISIRNAEEKDALKCLIWWNDGRVMEHAGFPDGLHTTLEQVLLDFKKDRDHFQRLILCFDHKPIGEMCFYLKEKKAEIGIKICEAEFQNKGIGPIALKLLIHYLFENKQVQKIELSTMLENKRAQHVYEKLGFQKVRVQKNCFKDQRNQLRSAVIYELDDPNRLK